MQKSESVLQNENLKYFGTKIQMNHLLKAGDLI